MESQALLVLTTCSGKEEAESLAAALVESRLAACVNAVDGITSTYRWKGSVEREHESLLVIKTTDDRYPALEAAIRQRSSYELPEILAVRVVAGSAGYLAWLGRSVREDAPEDAE